MNRILIVDDDVALCDLLSQYLQLDQFQVSCLHKGDEVIPELASGITPDVIVLDIMLPGCSGLDVLKQIRESSQIPVLMLTARGEDTDRIIGLELGADDYLPKPCNPRELSARLKAILRRVTPQPASAQNTAFKLPTDEGEFVFDTQARRVRADNQEIHLTATEFDLFEALVKQPDTTLSKQQLSQDILGKPLTSYDRSLDMHISNLRKKIPACIARTIETVRGVGYRYNPAEPLS